MEDQKQQSATKTHRAAQLFRAAAIHLAQLILPAAAYMGRTLLDLVSIARAALLQRARRKYPERAGDIDAKLTRLREQKAARWMSWGAAPGKRKMEIRAAAAVIAVIALLGLRAYVLHDRVSSQYVASQPVPARVRAAQEEARRQQRRVEEQVKAQAEKEKTTKTGSPANSRPEGSARADAEQFQQQRKAAAPGQWIVYGSSEEARRHEIPPVLYSGELGQWDDFSVTSPVVIKERGGFRLWYLGCRFFRDEYTCGVGHAQSRDGVAWQKSPGPVLAIADPIESQYLNSIAVARVGDEYLMWYAIDSNPTAQDNCAALNLATSKDGLAWKPQGVVLKANCQGTAHLWPSVFNDGKTLHLWYVDYDSGGGLIHLTSTDGRHWQRAGETPFKNFDNPGRIWVISDRGGGYRALFAQRQPSYFGILRSSDLGLWQVSNETLKPPDAAFSGGAPYTPAALLEPSGLWIWFAIRYWDSGAHAIALAFKREETR
jgi:hypothetical protein